MNQPPGDEPGYQDHDAGSPQEPDQQFFITDYETYASDTEEPEQQDVQPAGNNAVLSAKDLRTLLQEPGMLEHLIGNNAAMAELFRFGR